jgi:hypothetical protein
MFRQRMMWPVLTRGDPFGVTIDKTAMTRRE